MPKTRHRHTPPEFRRKSRTDPRPARSGELAREFEPTAPSRSPAVAQAGPGRRAAGGEGNGLSAAEREELARLRRGEKSSCGWSATFSLERPAGSPPRNGAIPPVSSNS